MDYQELEDPEDGKWAAFGCFLELLSATLVFWLVLWLVGWI